MSEPSHVSAPHDEHFSHHVRRYLLVFVALIIGTIFTVWASFIHMPSLFSIPTHTMNIVVALLIACTKAFLVAGYFMHLMSEKKMIYAILAFTVFFFAGLMFLTLYSIADVPPLTVKH